MARIAINLYTVRALEEPLLDVIDRVADAGYDGVQFSGEVESADPVAVGDRLVERGLDVVPPHVGIDGLEADPDEATAHYRELGAGGVVVPWLESAAFADRETAADTAARLDALGDALANLGLDLHYHNHDHEFQSVNGTDAYDVVAEQSGIGLEVDVGWVLTAGRDPAAVIRQYADRVDLVHVKDMADGEFRELGAGNLDVDACLAAAREGDAEWFVYEHDDPEDPVESLEHGAAFLADH
ncbi:MAG: sugar phosphate isomerase/epimerase family protein [Halobacteriaceae archaeon]